jgi:hypothetical protein
MESLSSEVIQELEQYVIDDFQRLDNQSKFIEHRSL